MGKDDLAQWLAKDAAGAPTAGDAAAVQATVDCLSQLIGFDTTSRNSNLALIEWARAYLEPLGASVRLSYNAERTKANLFATFGQGPGGIVLSGHTDVVPVDGQPWTTDPFRADVRDGRLYGRGACDMKGFIASVLAQAPAMAAARLKTPIHIALSYDEEVGCLGVPTLLADMQAAGIQPTGCIVGEPTSMRIVTAHKGGRMFRCRVRGRAAHSSLTPRGVNAIEYAARIIGFIQDLAEQQATQGPQIEGFDVPFSTLSTNLISGGSGRNIIPAECEFFFDYRYVPGVPKDRFYQDIRDFIVNQVEPRMKARHPDSGVDLESLGDVPALDAQERDDVLQLVRSLLRPHQSSKVAYGTEASFFQNVGVPSIVCGPGSIEQAHKADEFVPLDQLVECDRMIQSLISRLSV
ncbi:MAG: acetylornithine deacetylase [Rhodoferax sp.]|nr:acetylornithine deacetylase [Rhodoferax sp.]